MGNSKSATESTEVTRIPERGRSLVQSLDIKFADPTEIAWEIAERTALAQTPEELFGDTGPLGLREHLGVPFLVKRVRYLPSSLPDGPGFYALINAVTPDQGEPLVFTTGATGVLIQLARAEQMGWLDRPVAAKQSDTPTADGYYPYRLVFS